MPSVRTSLTALSREHDPRNEVRRGERQEGREQNLLGIHSRSELTQKAGRRGRESARSGVRSAESKVSSAEGRHFGLSTSDFALRTSHFGLRTSDFALSNLAYPTNLYPDPWIVR